MNQVSGLLFVANVQGASWDRRRRCFVTHDTAPPALQASPCLQHESDTLGQDDLRQSSRRHANMVCPSVSAGSSLVC